MESNIPKNTSFGKVLVFGDIAATFPVLACGIGKSNIYYTPIMAPNSPENPFLFLSTPFHSSLLPRPSPSNHAWWIFQDGRETRFFFSTTRCCGTGTSSATFLTSGFSFGVAHWQSNQGGLLNGTDPTKFTDKDPIRLWIIQVGE